MLIVIQSRFTSKIDFLQKTSCDSRILSLLLSYIEYVRKYYIYCNKINRENLFC